MIVRAIINQVKEYLDEVEALNDIEALNGSAPVEERIMRLIPECAVMYGEGKELDCSSLIIDQSGVGRIVLPDDWGRLKELRMSCWSRSVYDTIGEDSALYSRQQQLVTRGGSRRPVVAIVPYGEGRVMELYSIPTWDSRVSVERATYVPYPYVVNEDSDVAVTVDNKASLCYMIAVRVARSYGRENAANMLSSSLQEELTIKKQRI